MKFIAGLLLLSFVLYTSTESFVLEPRGMPQSCEDVISQGLCDKLKEIATALKLQASKVDDAINAAINKGIVRAQDVYKEAKDFLKHEVLAKTCEDFLTPTMCVKLRKIAQTLQIDIGKVEEAIGEVIGEGIKKATDIYVKVVEFLTKEVSSKICNDFLDPPACIKLREIAKTFKLKAAAVHAFVIDALIQGHEKKDEIYEAAVDFIRKEVLSKTCEDVLPAPVCSQLRAIATNLKVKGSEVDKFVREAVLKGYTRASQIIQAVKDYLKNEVLAKTCEDFLPDVICIKLKQAAAKLKVKAELVDKAVAEALAKGISTEPEIIDFCVNKIKEHIQCEDFLSASNCSRIRRIAKRFGILRDVEKFLRETIASGITTTSEIYQKIKDFIKSKIFG